MARSGYTTRAAAFKQIESASGNLETYMMHLLNIKMIYEEVHPKIAAHAERLMVAATHLQEATNDYKRMF